DPEDGLRAAAVQRAFTAVAHLGLERGPRIGGAAGGNDGPSRETVIDLPQSNDWLTRSNGRRNVPSVRVRCRDRPRLGAGARTTQHVRRDAHLGEVTESTLAHS